MISEYDSFACNPADEILTPCDKCTSIPEGFNCDPEADNYEDCPRWKDAEQEAYEDFLGDM